MAGDAPGSFSGYGSIFGNVDSYGDIVLPGAFAETLGRFLTAGFIADCHDWGDTAEAVAYPTSAREDERGLYLEAQFHSTEHAQQVRTVMAERAAAGKSIGLSIGYETRDAEIVSKDDPRVVGLVKHGDPDPETWTGGYRLLKAVELYEVSVVLVPANTQATAVAVKADAKGQWTRAFINDLPDSAFAVILDGGEKDDAGKTVPRDLRKLPHHDETGKVDEPHLLNSLAREPQTDMPEAKHTEADRHLRRHADALGIGKAAPDGLALILVELDHLGVKAGRVMSARNQGQMHEAMEALAALHGATCDMGADCPMEAGKSRRARALGIVREWARLNGVA